MAGPSVLHHQLFLQGSTSATGSLTPTNQPTLGNLLVVMTAQDATSSGETISDNQGTPNTWTKRCSAITSQDNVGSIWTAPVTQTSAGFAVTYSGFGTL